MRAVPCVHHLPAHAVSIEKMTISKNHMIDEKGDFSAAAHA
jgi:hypothetical protein